MVHIIYILAIVIFMIIRNMIIADRWYLYGRLVQIAFDEEYKIEYDQDNSITVYRPDGGYDVYIGGNATKWVIKKFKRYDLPIIYKECT